MVLINGLPAARMGNTTLDGSVLISGDPSVLIGGDLFSVPPFITIHGTVDFQAKVLRDLYLISTTPSGERLFASLAATGHTVDIQIGSKSIDQSANGLTKSIPCLSEGSVKNNEDPNDPRASNGTGIDSLVRYDPDRSTAGAPDWGKPPNYGSDANLFHELTHADGMAHGQMDSKLYPNAPSTLLPFAKGGERRAMGLSPYDDESKYPFSENSYRGDRGYMKAPFY